MFHNDDFLEYQDTCPNCGDLEKQLSSIKEQLALTIAIRDGYRFALQEAIYQLEVCRPTEAANYAHTLRKMLESAT